jgi:hypothetical protein
MINNAMAPWALQDGDGEAFKVVEAKYGQTYEFRERDEEHYVVELIIVPGLEELHPKPATDMEPPTIEKVLFRNHTQECKWLVNALNEMARERDVLLRIIRHQEIVAYGEGMSI